MADLNAFLRKLHENLNILHEREAKYGSNTPLKTLQAELAELERRDEYGSLGLSVQIPISCAFHADPPNEPEINIVPLNLLLEIRTDEKLL